MGIPGLTVLVKKRTLMKTRSDFQNSKLRDEVHRERASLKIDQA
jgi:hypothetical protein